jgi:hypothetical protein
MVLFDRCTVQEVYKELHTGEFSIGLLGSILFPINLIYRSKLVFNYMLDKIDSLLHYCMEPS